MFILFILVLFLLFNVVNIIKCLLNIKWKNQIKSYHFCLSVLLTIGFISCSVFIFPNAFIRLYQSAKDLDSSIAYYFCKLFNLPIEINATVTYVPSIIEIAPPSIIPNNNNLFNIKMSMYWNSLFNNETLVFYISNALTFLSELARYLLIIMPLFILMFYLFKRYFIENNKTPDMDSKQLIMYKKIVDVTIIPLKNIILKYYSYLLDHKVFKIIWITIWLLNFSIIVIAVEFLAFYFYFVLSFDVVNIYIQFYKLFYDLSAMVNFIPKFIWIIIVIMVLLRIRKNWGYMRLYHYENRNKGFSNSLGQVSMLCGEMGTGKTSTLTDITLSLAVMYRQKAFEKILECDVKFPNFPFINLENEFKTAIKYHQVYNLATAKIWIWKKRNRCTADGTIVNCEKCFNYDYEKYGDKYYDNLKEMHLFDVLEIYVQVYFIYIIETSLIVSNYAIREDSIKQDLGNFPMWDDDFFKRDSRLTSAYENHSHVLDFDMLRLGKKILENNINSDVLEFGLIIITEGGKERLNMLGTREMKRKDDEANQLNDLMDLWLKMYRHSATVDNYCFGKVLFDEQRPMSFGADVREICEKLVYIREKKETQCTLFLFDLDTMIYEFFISKYIKYYYKYRFYRSDNSLLIYLFKKVCSKVINYYHNTINIFGYNRLMIECERGTMDGEVDVKKYYLCHKKIYSNRYATDCFNDFFFSKSINSYLGLADLIEYASHRATIDELKNQNSYFINKLTRQIFNTEE